MMGVQAASAQPFYDFCLDDHVPSDHLLRGIDGHLDFEDSGRLRSPFIAGLAGADGFAVDAKPHRRRSCFTG
jgi:hypothetical protein